MQLSIPQVLVIHMALRPARLRFYKQINYMVNPSCLIPRYIWRYRYDWYVDVCYVADLPCIGYPRTGLSSSLGKDNQSAICNEKMITLRATTGLWPEMHFSRYLRQSLRYHVGALTRLRWVLTAMGICRFLGGGIPSIFLQHFEGGSLGRRIAWKEDRFSLLSGELTESEINVHRSLPPLCLLQ
jgi:hypothetical protein